MNQNKRMSGRVIWFNITKHYGFIESGGESYFFHGSEVKTNNTLKKDDRVTFFPKRGDMDRNKDKWQAVEVHKIEDKDDIGNEKDDSDYPNTSGYSGYSPESDFPSKA